MNQVLIPQQVVCLLLQLLAVLIEAKGVERHDVLSVANEAFIIRDTGGLTSYPGKGVRPGSHLARYAKRDEKT